MPSIKEYLERGQAGKVFDPNQGMYVDPQTGRPFVPTFTNIEGSDIGQRISEQYGEQPDPYMIGPEARMVPAGQHQVPERIGADQPQLPTKDQEQGIDRNDPWAMANAATKKMLPDIFEELFPGKPFNSTLGEKDWAKYQSRVKHTRNMLVDRFKWQIERRDEEEKRKLDAAKSLGIKPRDIIQIQNDLTKAYADAFMDPSRGDPTLEEYRQRGLENYLENIAKYTGRQMPGTESVTKSPGAKLDENRAVNQYTPEKEEEFDVNQAGMGGGQQRGQRLSAQEMKKYLYKGQVVEQRSDGWYIRTKTGDLKRIRITR